MNTLIKIIVYHFIAAVCCYLFASFGEWNLDITEWTDRGSIVFILYFCLSSIFITSNQISYDKRK